MSDRQTRPRSFSCALPYLESSIQTVRVCNVLNDAGINVPGRNHVTDADFEVTAANAATQTGYRRSNTGPLKIQATSVTTRAQCAMRRLLRSVAPTVRAKRLSIGRGTGSATVSWNAEWSCLW